MPKEVEDKLLALFEEYAEIFALKDDRMTVNNFYEQKLRLSYPTPVYVKIIVYHTRKT